MTLPRYALPEDDDDSTSPAQFLLKLPPGYERKLSALSTPTPAEWSLAPPVIAPARAKARSPRRLLAVALGAAAALAIVAGVGGAFAQSSEGPVGISKHAPKSLEHFFRASTRQSGVAHVTPPQRTHARRKH